MDKFRLKILFLTPYALRFDAGFGGGRVMANLAAQLARHHDVALLYLRAPDEPLLDDALRERCAWVKEVIVPDKGETVSPRWLRLARMWLSLLGGKPRWASDRAAEEFHWRLKALVEMWQPDIVQFECHLMGQYLSALEGNPVPRVLTQHDPGTSAARDVCRSVHKLGLLLPYLELFAWWRFERKVYQQVRAIVVFTEHDRRAVASLAGQTPIVTVPFSVPVPEKALDPAGSHPLALLFVGAFLHLPNVDAATRLVDNILPRVRSRFPDLRLYIVGSDPPPELQQRASEHVVVTGYVPDLVPYLDRAAVIPVPLRLGGGMRVKVMEALAAGKAVVASSLAVEGLDLVDGEQVILAESDEAFSQAIIELLESPERRVALAQSARAWARANLGWEQAAASYERVYHSLIMNHVYEGNWA